MRQINILINRFLQYKKKKFTYFVLIELITSFVIILGLSFLNKESLISDEEELPKLIFDGYTYGIEKNYIIYALIPVILTLITIIFASFIIIKKDVHKDGINSKKLVKPLFIYSIITVGVTAILCTFVGILLILKSESLSLLINHRLSFIITGVLQIIDTIEIYRWRTEFNLESLYGNNSVYR